MPRSPSKPRSRIVGFTLIELLVVVAIIALLISILLPSLSRAREQAKAVVCSTHMNGLWKAIYYYTSDNKNTLPNFSPLYTHGIRDFFWTSQISKYVVMKPDIFLCPSDKDPVVRFVEGDNSGRRPGQQQPAGRGGRGGGGASTSVALPLSYHGTCDMDSVQTWTRGPTAYDQSAGAIYGLFPRRLSEFKYPSRDLILIECGKEQIATDPTSCFRWGHLAEANVWTKDSSFLRHYGGQSPESNGSNFLFLDGHAKWHSARDTNTKLVCYQRTREEKPPGGDVCAGSYPYPIRNLTVPAID